MKRYISLLLTIALISSVLLSCSENTASTDTSNDTSADTSANDTLWVDAVGIEISENYVRTVDSNDIYCAKLGNGLPDNFDLSTTITLTKRSNVKFVFESELNDDNSIKNGYAISLDARTNTLNALQYSKNEVKSIAETKLPKSGIETFSLEISRFGTFLDVKLFENNKNGEMLSYISLNVNQLKGEVTAFTMSGLITLSEYKWGEYKMPTEKIETFQNPVLSDNKDFGDPTVYYENGKYYMMTTGSFTMYESEDLVNFKSIGLVANKDELYGHTYYGGASVFKYDGIYYMFYTSYMPDSTYGIMCVATSDKVTGPYTQTKQTTVDSIVCPQRSAGAFPFIANDGKTYLYWYETVSTGNTIFGAEVEFDNGVVKVDGSTKKMLVYPTEEWEMKSDNGVSGRVCERANVYYHNGYYYLFYATSHWISSYGEAVAISTSPLGDFTKYPSPILNTTSTVHGPGCTYIVSSPNKNEMFVVYAAHKSASNLKRDVYIDRLTFADVGDGPDIPVIYGPSSTPQPMPD